MLDRDRDVGVAGLALGMDADGFPSCRGRVRKIVDRREITREVVEQQGEHVLIDARARGWKRLANDRNCSPRLAALVFDFGDVERAFCSPRADPSKRSSLRSCSYTLAAVSRSPRPALTCARASSRRTRRWAEDPGIASASVNAASASWNLPRYTAVVTYWCSAHASTEASPLVRACSNRLHR